MTYSSKVESQTSKPPRLSAQDWEAAALDAIAVGGLSAVAIEPLARTLGVTKGSFYAHFRNRGELVEAALANWERSHGAEGLGVFTAISDPAERLRFILIAALQFSQSGIPSPHVSLLGELHDTQVQATVSRVNKARLALISDAYCELGLPEPQARRRAQMAYSAYLGLLQLAQSEPDSRLNGRDLEEMIEETLDVLLP